MRFFLPILVLMIPIVSHGEVVTDKQVWANFNSFISFKNDVQVYLEIQPRWVEDYQKHGTSLYRGAVGKHLSNGFSAWLGYGFIEKTFPTYLHEDRPFLQLMHNGNLSSGLKIINRTRFESRYFRGEELPSYRFRHLLRGQYKFGNTPWGLIAYNEWFWNANNVNADIGVREGFDQNRAFFGVGYHFGEKAQHLSEVGYMNQYVNGKTKDSSNDVLALQLTFRI